jgi:Epoxide hydrolase N terminus
LCTSANSNITEEEESMTATIAVQESTLATGNSEIRPFQKVTVPETQLTELRSVSTTQSGRNVNRSQMQPKACSSRRLKRSLRYWGTEYDWRKCEARLNALPQFITEIDGLDIHFIHVRSKHENALPLMVTHGWPGSVVEQLKIIDPLTNPTAHGGSASDAFDVVIPSIPGYGYSGKPTMTDWGPDRIARAWYRA